MPNQNEYLAKKSLLDTKQDVLTAGDNININNNNVISVQGLPKDVKVDGSSVVDINGNANINLTGKQDALTAGNNITIQNNVISANIEANPQDTPTDDLDSIEIDGTVYNIAGSGGSSVTPNPIGTPTDTLNTIEIDGTIFDIAGSGSGSGLIDDTIYSSSVDNSVIPLSNSIANYDYIWVMAGYTQDGQNIKLASIFNVSNLKDAIGTTERFGISNDAYYIYFSVDSLTQFSKYIWQDRVFIQEVHGLKFGGGSGGGKTSITTLYDTFINSVGEITLTNKIEDYDFIMVDFGFNGTDKAHNYIYIPAEDIPNKYPYVSSPNNTTPHILLTPFDDQYARMIMGSADNKLFIFQIGQTVGIYGVYGIKCGSGGTSVEANPQEAPTDTLTKIKIEDTVYEIQGGGSSGGSGLQQTVLWDYVQDNSGTIPYDIYSVTLRDDINNYDAITLELVSWSGDLDGSWRGTNISNTFFVDILNNQLEPGNIIVCTFAQRSVKFYIHDNIVSTTVRNESSTNGLVRVYGLTFGGGKAASEIIPISAGDGTTSRTFTFDKTPKFIAYYWNDPLLDSGWNTTAHFVWGQEFVAYSSATNTVSINNNYQGCIYITYNGNSITFTGGNAFSVCNTTTGSGYMYVDYGGGGSGSSSEPDISDMTWTAITSTSYGQSTAVAIPQGTKRLVLTAEYEGIVTKVAEEKIENIQKLLDTSLQNTWNMGAEYADTSGNHTFVAMSVNNNLATAYSGYSGVVVKIYALS